MHILKLYKMYGIYVVKKTTLESLTPVCCHIQFQPKINIVQCVFLACQ